MFHITYEVAGGLCIVCRIALQVNAISFSEKGDYFVTVGVRLVKFWYIGSTDNANKVHSPVVENDVVIHLSCRDCLCI